MGEVRVETWVGSRRRGTDEQEVPFPHSGVQLRVHHLREQLHQYFLKGTPYSIRPSQDFVVDGSWTYFSLFTPYSLLLLFDYLIWTLTYSLLA